MAKGQYRVVAIVAVNHPMVLCSLYLLDMGWALLNHHDVNSLHSHPGVVCEGLVPMSCVKNIWNDGIKAVNGSL